MVPEVVLPTFTWSNHEVEDAIKEMGVPCNQNAVVVALTFCTPKLVLWVKGQAKVSVPLLQPTMVRRPDAKAQVLVVAPLPRDDTNRLVVDALVRMETLPKKVEVDIKVAVVEPTLSWSNCEVEEANNPSFVHSGVVVELAVTPKLVAGVQS